MSAHFDVVDTPLPQLKLIQRKLIGDHRGYLERMYCVDQFAAMPPGKRIAQINHTLTAKKGTARGLHFQYPPYAETKIVSCLRGEAFDVAVDVRQGSPTFLRWHAELLSAHNHRSLLIPEGFAHGFQALSDECEMLYFHTATYQPSAEGGLNLQDPMLDIPWPTTVCEVSHRDTAHPLLTDAFRGVSL